MEKHENQQRSRINKAFEKIPRFDGTNPNYCFDWLEQTEALVNEHHGEIYSEELLLNCGTSVSKTIHALPQGVTNQSIKDAVLRNHSNLRTVSQRSNAYHQLHQKPDEALQSYNTSANISFLGMAVVCLLMEGFLLASLSFEACTGLGNGCKRFCTSRSLLGSYVHQESI